MGGYDKKGKRVETIDRLDAKKFIEQGSNNNVCWEQIKPTGLDSTNDVLKLSLSLMIAVNAREILILGGTFHGN